MQVNRQRITPQLSSSLISLYLAKYVVLSAAGSYYVVTVLSKEELQQSVSFGGYFWGSLTNSSYGGMLLPALKSLFCNLLLLRATEYSQAAYLISNILKFCFKKVYHQIYPISVN